MAEKYSQEELHEAFFIQLVFTFQAAAMQQLGKVINPLTGKVEKNVEQAQESLRIADLNYSEGLATSLDVSSVRALLTQAKTNYSQALFDYVISIAELDKAMGMGWKE